MKTISVLFLLATLAYDAFVVYGFVRHTPQGGIWLIAILCALMALGFTYLSSVLLIRTLAD